MVELDRCIPAPLHDIALPHGRARTHEEDVVGYHQSSAQRVEVRCTSSIKTIKIYVQKKCQVPTEGCGEPYLKGTVISYL